MDLIEATGLWANKAKDGSTYYSGNLGGMKLLVFPNRHKEPGSKQPDFRLCIGEGKRQKEGAIKASESVFTDPHDAILDEAILA